MKHSLAAAALMTVCGGMLFAQTFEVATVKPSDPGATGEMVTFQGVHRFVIKNMTLKNMIGVAYSLAPKLISGGPAWIDTVRFDLIGDMPGETRPKLEQALEMLRALLSDRFQVKFHHERKELSVYKLVTAKGGPKLESSTAPAEAPYTLMFQPTKDGILLPGRNATMAQFAAAMQLAPLDRPVIDKTGLFGRFDFDLEWEPDETQFHGHGARPPGAADSNKPNIFTAIQQQLGLKLESAKGPVELFVVDRAEKPGDN
jgi:uncharacterized protein (TIGR03435 family)